MYICLGHISWCWKRRQPHNFICFFRHTLDRKNHYAKASDFRYYSKLDLQSTTKPGCCCHPVDGCPSVRGHDHNHNHNLCRRHPCLFHIQSLIPQNTNIQNQKCIYNMLQGVRWRRKTDEVSMLCMLTTISPATTASTSSPVWVPTIFYQNKNVAYALNIH